MPHEWGFLKKYRRSDESKKKIVPIKLDQDFLSIQKYYIPRTVINCIDSSIECPIFSVGKSLPIVFPESPGISSEEGRMSGRTSCLFNEINKCVKIDLPQSDF